MVYCIMISIGLPHKNMWRDRGAPSRKFEEKTAQEVTAAVTFQSLGLVADENWGSCQHAFPWKPEKTVNRNYKDLQRNYRIYLYAYIYISIYLYVYIYTYILRDPKQIISFLSWNRDRAHGLEKKQKKTGGEIQSHDNPKRDCSQYMPTYAMVMLGNWYGTIHRDSP